MLFLKPLTAVFSSIIYYRQLVIIILFDLYIGLFIYGMN